MSLKRQWQRICQSLGKELKMSQENQEFLDENIENTDNQSKETLQEGNVTSEQEKTIADELAEMKDRNLRLFAEFENFRKRTAKEKLELSKYANESLLLDLLPVLDDFERAKVQMENSGDENLINGIELIQNKFTNTLSNKGLKALEVNAGDDFDLEKHEAITQIAAPSEDLVGKVIDVVETGYTLNDKVIRFAKVVVGK